MKALFNNCEFLSILQKRLYTVQRRSDETAACYGARVLYVAIKNFSRPALTAQTRLPSATFFKLICYDTIKNKIKFRLVDFYYVEVNWSREIDMLSHLEEQSRAGLVRGTRVTIFGTAAKKFPLKYSESQTDMYF